MSHTVRFKLSNKDADTILSLINGINRTLKPNEPMFTLDSYAKTCIISKTEEIFHKEAMIRAKLKAEKDAVNDTSSNSPDQQQQQTTDIAGSIPFSGLAQVSDNGEA